MVGSVGLEGRRPTRCADLRNAGQHSCELAPDEQEHDTRYTGASLPESEDWIE